MWVIPSRGRPDQLKRLASVGFKTSAWIWLDADDPCYQQYEPWSVDWPKSWVMGGGLSQMPLSEIYNGFKLNQDWYGFLADDVLPETTDWDLRLVEAAGSNGLAFGDDLINGESHAAHFVLGGDLVREIGWLSLPGLSRLYIDTVWNDIARARGVYRYLPHVKMPHLHFSNKKALYDQTYKKPNKAEDKRIYEEWRKTTPLLKVRD